MFHFLITKIKTSFTNSLVVFTQTQCVKGKRGTPKHIPFQNSDSWRYGNSTQYGGNANTNV